MRYLLLCLAVLLVSCGEQGTKSFSNDELLVALIPNDPTVYYQNAILSLTVNSSEIQTDTLTNPTIGFPAKFFTVPLAKVNYQPISFDLDIDGISSTASLGTWLPDSKLALEDTNSDGRFLVIIGREAVVQMAVAKVLRTASKLRDSLGLSYVFYGTSTLSSSSATTCAGSFGTIDSINSIKDCRDGKTYATVVIGSQTWLAQNLNYTPASGNTSCYGDLAGNCTIFGRLYDYAAAMTSCPTGWHLPDTTEWSTLITYAGGTTASGSSLRATSNLWTSYTGITNTDIYGFSALPGGFDSGNAFNYMYNYGCWWTATTNGVSNAFNQRLYYANDLAFFNSNAQSFGFSVRCLKD